MTAFNETPSDTGVTQSDTFVMKAGRVIATTAVTASDSPSRLLVAFRVASDTGTAFSDVFKRYLFGFISDAGQTFSDAFTLEVVPAADSPFSITSDRSWRHADQTRKWTTNAVNRFTFTTVPD